MQRKKILPTIEAVYDEEGLVFYCDGEPIEDMEFSWEDLADSELVTEVAEELVEYIDSDELEEIDNPVQTVRQALRKFRKAKTPKKPPEEEGEVEEEDELEGFDDEAD
jgi:hypothetical protein